MRSDTTIEREAGGRPGCPLDALPRASHEVQVGDAVELARGLAPASIDCGVTSPPYWAPDQGQRDYGEDERELGREPTVEEYARRVAAVFAAARPALRPDATVWVNVGDAQVGGRPARAPARIVDAMEEAGFALLSEVVWVKPDANPRDSRHGPIPNHEWILRFGLDDPGGFMAFDPRPPLWDPIPDKIEHGGFTRSAWLFPVSREKGFHLATFPPELPLRCIRASTAPARCAVCEARVERVVERRRVATRKGESFKPDGMGGFGRAKKDRRRHETKVSPRGWRRGCSCAPGLEQLIPAVVFDPFAGLATTGVAAKALGRSFVGFELYERFALDARDRLADDGLRALVKLRRRSEAAFGPRGFAPASEE